MAASTIPLQKLLGKEDRFFELFEASADASRRSVQALRKFLLDPGAAPSLDEFVASRRADKAITSQINELLCTTFVSAMESEDIQALSNALYKIPKTVEKIAERILLAPHLLQDVDVSPQVDLLENAANTLHALLQDLRKSAPLPIIREHNERLQTIEGDADKFVLELLRGLYNGQHDAAKVVFLKDVFELMERVTDRCRDAGNIIVRIVLKGT